MCHGVLSQYGNIEANTGVLENRAVVVKTPQCILQVLQGLFADDVGAGNVTEFEKHLETAHNIGRNMALNGWQVNLFHG
jgi:hypothetical protein